jgi:hypothetical protein
LPGSFEPPTGLDPAQRVLSGLAQAPYRLRVDLRAERLDWVPAVLASIDRPFIIGRPR